MAVDVKTWASKFKNLTDNDETIQCMGKYYTCSFLYDMTDCKVIVEMHDGKVKTINTDPAPLDSVRFRLARQRPDLAGIRQTGAEADVPRHLGRQLLRGSEAGRQSSGADAEISGISRFSSNCCASAGVPV